MAWDRAQLKLDDTQGDLAAKSLGPFEREARPMCQPWPSVTFLAL